MRKRNTSHKGLGLKQKRVHLSQCFHTGPGTSFIFYQIKGGICRLRDVFKDGLASAERMQTRVTRRAFEQTGQVSASGR